MASNQSKIERVIVIVLDSVGCGDAPDAKDYGDEGTNTIGNIAKVIGGINLPNMQKMGLGNLTDIQGVPPTDNAIGAYGRLTEISVGKDTTTGHWELGGIHLEKSFPTYPDGFPADVIAEFEERIQRKTLGNYPASGTEIIKVLGEEHLKTGYPIVYTSGDSVFQIAAHVEVIPLDELYHFCELARALLINEHTVGRVIARPFTGKLGNFVRTEDRKDYSVLPPSDTILDAVSKAGLDMIGVGKIEDIFAEQGLTESNHTGNNMAGIEAIIDFCQQDNHGLIFANLVDFDSLYGHRNNPQGYADALMAFDKRLPEIQAVLRPSDVLMLTADHGNDPTTPGTDHSRERVPLLIMGEPIKQNTNFGTSGFLVRPDRFLKTCQVCIQNVTLCPSQVY
ncbi:MAG: phosphopentomutase [Anaerolineaceae bacterium 4572_78]|nr:MAG: phosphopentomutase [Anaerolineaceae bacterium 4572_78]